MRHIAQTIERGQAGVYQVASQLIVRGHQPSFPATDVGVDLFLSSGLKIQVKTTLRASQHHRLREGTFSFSLSKAQVIKQRKYVPGKARQFSEVCDFVILWAIEPHRFWIVPAAVLDGRHTIQISKTTQWRNIDLDAIQSLRAQGYTYEAIASHIGSNARTVRRRLNEQPLPKKRYANMSNYENAWTLLDGAVATLTEANTVADAVSQSAREGVEPSRIPEV